MSHFLEVWRNLLEDILGAAPPFCEFEASLLQDTAHAQEEIHSFLGGVGSTQEVIHIEAVEQVMSDFRVTLTMVLGSLL